MTIKRFEELIAWQKARKLTADIYVITKIDVGHISKLLTAIDDLDYGNIL